MRQPDDVAFFALELTKTAELFGEVMSESRTLLYFEALENLALQDVVKGLRLARQRSKFFPKPAEIRERIEGSDEDQAALQWSHALRGSREALDGVAGDVIARMGGMWEIRNNMTTYVAERAFTRLYRALRAEDRQIETPASPKALNA